MSVNIEMGIFIESPEIRLKHVSAGRTQRIFTTNAVGNNKGQEGHKNGGPMKTRRGGPSRH